MKRRTKAQIREARQDDWSEMVRRGFAARTTCLHCGQVKNCRSMTRKRMACQECFLTKGTPKIPKSVEA